MWNLGRGGNGPVTQGGQGFDQVIFPEDFSFQKDAYFDDDGHYVSDRLTEKVLEFVEKNHVRPFFVYLSDQAAMPHLTPSLIC